MTIGTYGGYDCLHRPDDFPLMARILSLFKPKTLVEIGTHFGGFASFLAHTSSAWGGQVITIDAFRHPESKGLEDKYSNLTFLKDDLSACLSKKVVDILSKPECLLYCSRGGNKVLTWYSSYMGKRGLVGCHGWGLEVNPDDVIPVMVSFRFSRIFWRQFEALAHPEWYPKSLSRFWWRR